MTKKERLALLEQHITKRELYLSQVLYLAVYLAVVFSLPATNLLLYIGMCLFVLIGLGAIRDNLLLFINERRCKAKEVDPEVSSDDDSV